mgnify:CR=1 FL=1
MKTNRWNWISTQAPFTRQDVAHPLKQSLPGADDILRVELSNGIAVLSRSDFHSPSVVVNGYLQSGSIFDPDERIGLADFVASSLKRGSAHYPFLEIYNLLETAGASLGFSCGTHVTSFFGRALSEDLDLLLDLLSDILINPIFPADQIEKLRAQLLSDLAIRAQDTGEMASLAFDQIVYAGHPYARPEDGYPETISAITLSDLANFHKKHYGPAGMAIAIVGAVDPLQAVEKVIERLGSWTNPEQPEAPMLPPLSRLSETTTRKVTIAGKAQSDIQLGVAGPPRKSPDYLAASLGNNILGQFGMMGRLGESVREKAGLAYDISSNLSGGAGPGPWVVSAGVNPAHVEMVIDMIIREIHKFVEEGPTQEELSDSQANFIGRLPMSLESNAGVAAALINLERHDLGLDYYRRYADLVSAITVENVVEVSRRYLDLNRLGIAVAGPE